MKFLIRCMGPGPDSSGPDEKGKIRIKSKPGVGCPATTLIDLGASHDDTIARLMTSGWLMTVAKPINFKAPGDAVATPMCSNCVAKVFGPEAFDEALARRNSIAAQQSGEETN